MPTLDLSAPHSASDDAPDPLQGRLAEHVDRPVEDSVLLAPRLSLTPGGTAREDSFDADIESPFAKPVERTDEPHTLSARRQDSDSAESLDAFIDGSDEEVFSSVAAISYPRPASTERQEQSALLPPAAMNRADSEHQKPRRSSNRERISDISGDMLPSIGALMRDVDVTRSPEPGAESQGLASASLEPGERDSDGFSPETPSPPAGAVPPEMRHHLPMSPLPPQRVAVADSPAEQRPGFAVRGLKVASSTSARSLSWMRAKLLNLANDASAKGWPLILRLGSTVAGHGSEIAKTGLSASKRASASAIQVAAPVVASWLDSSRSSLGAAGKASAEWAYAAAASLTRETVEASLALGRRAGTVGSRVGTAGWQWGKRQVAGRQVTGEAKASAGTDATVPDMQLQKLLNAIKEGAGSGPVPAAGGLPVAKAASVVPSPEPSTTSSETTPKAKSEPGAAKQPPAAVGPPWWVPKPAHAGLALASIAALFVAFGPNPTRQPVSAVLTMPIPEKRASGAAAIDRTASPSAPNNDSAKTVLGAVPFLPVLNDPIADMIAHVEKRLDLLAKSADTRTLFAGAKSPEGLDQFTKAADVVGLEHLLKPGESYTIFVPNDAAFAKLPPGVVDGLLDPSGHERLLTLLSHHIVAERLTFDEIAGRVHEYTSLAGKIVTIDATDAIRVGDAGMVEADLQTNDGVLHVIDQVLAIPAY